MPNLIALVSVVTDTGSVAPGAPFVIEDEQEADALVARGFAAHEAAYLEQIAARGFDTGASSPRPGDILRPAGNAGLYVKRAAGTITLDAFASGTQYRFTLDPSQAAALAEQLVAATDGLVMVHADAAVFLSQYDPAHSQG